MDASAVESVPSSPRMLDLFAGLQSALTLDEVERAFLGHVVGVLDADGHGLYRLDPQTLDPVAISTDVTTDFVARYTEYGRFDDPEEIKLDRSPNRPSAFGLGIHRCLGSNIARVVWQIVVQQVLTRMPDYQLDLSAAERYPSIGITNGWKWTPVTFTPGRKVGPRPEVHSQLVRVAPMLVFGAWSLIWGAALGGGFHDREYFLVRGD
jgi:hypothetical protein